MRFVAGRLIGRRRVSRRGVSRCVRGRLSRVRGDRSGRLNVRGAGVDDDVGTVLANAGQRHGADLAIGGADGQFLTVGAVLDADQFADLGAVAALTVEPGVRVKLWG